MRLIVGAVGRMKPGPEKQLFDDYILRTAKSLKSLGFSGIETFEVDPVKDRSATIRKRRDGEALLAKLPPGGVVCALDERGDPLTSLAFSNFIGALRDRGEPAVAFLIGGADGHAEAVRTASRKKLAFGPATWPHMLVRAMLAEQLYRATTILSGHPYHRE